MRPGGLTGKIISFRSPGVLSAMEIANHTLSVNRFPEVSGNPRSVDRGPAQTESQRGLRIGEGRRGGGETA